MNDHQDEILIKRIFSAIAEWLLQLFGMKKEEPQIKPILQPWPERKIYIPKETTRIERDSQTYILRGDFWFFVFWEEGDSSLELCVDAEETLNWLPKKSTNDDMITDDSKWYWLRHPIYNVNIPFSRDIIPGPNRFIDCYPQQNRSMFDHQSLLLSQTCCDMRAHNDIRYQLERKLCDIDYGLMRELIDCSQTERIERRQF